MSGDTGTPRAAYGRVVAKLSNGWGRLEIGLARVWFYRVGGYKGVVLWAVIERSWCVPWFHPPGGGRHPAPVPARLNVSQLARETGLSQSGLNEAKRALIASGELIEHPDRTLEPCKRYDLYADPLPPGILAYGLAGGRLAGDRRRPGNGIPAENGPEKLAGKPANPPADDPELAEKPANSLALDALKLAGKPANIPDTGDQAAEQLAGKPAKKLAGKPANSGTDSPISLRVKFKREANSRATLDSGNANADPDPVPAVQAPAQPPDPVPVPAASFPTPGPSSGAVPEVPPSDRPDQAAGRPPATPGALPGRITPVQVPLSRREEAAIAMGDCLPGDVEPDEALLRKTLAAAEAWYPNRDDLRTGIRRHRRQIPTDWMYVCLKRLAIAGKINPSWNLMKSIIVNDYFAAGPDGEPVGPGVGPDRDYDDDLRFVPYSQRGRPASGPVARVPASPPVPPPVRLDEAQRSRYTLPRRPDGGGGYNGFRHGGGGADTRGGDPL